MRPRTDPFPEARSAFVIRLLSRGYAVEHLHFAGVVATASADRTDARRIELGSRAAYPGCDR